MRLVHALNPHRRLVTAHGPLRFNSHVLESIKLWVGSSVPLVLHNIMSLRPRVCVVGWNRAKYVVVWLIVAAESCCWAQPSLQHPVSI